MASMNQATEKKEGELPQEAVLYIFYVPVKLVKEGQFMFEYKNEPNLRVCLPEVRINKGENPLFPLISRIRTIEIEPKQIKMQIKITVLSDFSGSDSGGKNVNYHPLLIEGWEGKFKNNIVPLWADYVTALSIPELRASDRRALDLAQEEVIRAKEERKVG